jgi:hypothetical protein
MCRLRLRQRSILYAFGRVRRRNVDMAYERSPNEKAISKSGGEGTEIVAASAAPTDYQSALLQIIESAASDPRQLRRLVYELARQNLKKETSQRDCTLTPNDVRESVLALETAIARVEADSSRGARADMRLPRLHTMLEPPDDAMAQERLVDVKPWRSTGDRASAIRPAAVVPLKDVNVCIRCRSGREHASAVSMAVAYQSASFSPSSKSSTLFPSGSAT